MCIFILYYGYNPKLPFFILLLESFQLWLEELFQLAPVLLTLMAFLFVCFEHVLTF